MEDNNTPSVEKQYFEFLKQGEFKVQECQSCQQFFYFPRVMCTHCHSTQYKWKTPKLTGRVYSFTEYKHSTQEGNRTTLLIDMDDGFRVMGAYIGQDQIAIDDVVTLKPATEKELQFVKQGED